MDEVGTEAASERDSGIDASTGAQVVVGTPADGDPLAALPRRAYDNLLIISVREHPRRLETRIRRRGRDPANVGVVPVIPGADEYDGVLWTTDPVSPDDLTGIGMRFSDAIAHLETGRGWVLLDALGLLFVYSEDARICRFVQTLANRVRSKAVTGAYCVNPEVISDETYERIWSLCDEEHEIR